MKVFGVQIDGQFSEYVQTPFQVEHEEAILEDWLEYKDQRIVIVGQRVTPEIRQTATFLCSKGLRVTCVEFTFFQAEGGTRLLSQEIVVGSESEKPKQVLSGSLPVVTEDAFLASVDDNGRAVFARILEFAKSRALPIHWGTKGFSLNVNIDGLIQWCDAVGTTVQTHGLKQ